MIEFRNVKKYFTDKKTTVKALDGITLTIDQGEMIALMGPSGSGKTTLLNIVGGIFKPTDGSYLFHGQPLAGDEQGMACFRRDNIGFILQHHSLIGARDIRYNISLPLKYQGMKSAAIQEKVEIIAQTLGIADKLHAYPHMLSGGQAQRVAIARAVIANPKVILADEPTSSLDDCNKHEVLQILKALHNAGTTIVIATHDRTVAQECNKVLTIQGGTVISA